MPDMSGWGSLLPIAQDYKIGQQTIEANDQTIQANKLKAIADQNDQAIDADAASYMATIAKGGTIPGEVDTTNAAPSMSQAFMRTAQHLVQLGAPKKAQEFIKAAQELEKGELDSVAKQTEIQKNNAATLVTQSDLVGRYLGNAHSQQEWDDGIQSMEESGAFTPTQMDHFKTVPYHESTAAVMRDHALSVKSQADLANQAADNDRAERAQASQNAARDRAFALAQHRSDEADRLRRLAEKTGKAATGPSKEDVDGVTAVIVNQIYNGKHPGKNDPALKAGAVTVAARAKSMVQADKALDWPTAVSRAVAESQAEGDWQVTAGVKGKMPWDDDTPDTTKFNDVGKNKRSPMALPPKGSKPAAGKYYQTSRGVAKWDGKQFIPVE